MYVAVQVSRRGSLSNKKDFTSAAAGGGGGGGGRSERIMEMSSVSEDEYHPTGQTNPSPKSVSAPSTQIEAAIRSSVHQNESMRTSGRHPLSRRITTDLYQKRGSDDIRDAVSVQSGNPDVCGGHPSNRSVSLDSAFVRALSRAPPPPTWSADRTEGAEGAVVMEPRDSSLQYLSASSLISPGLYRRLQVNCGVAPASPRITCDRQPSFCASFAAGDTLAASIDRLGLPNIDEPSTAGGDAATLKFVAPLAALPQRLKHRPSVLSVAIKNRKLAHACVVAADSLQAATRRRASCVTAVDGSGVSSSYEIRLQLEQSRNSRLADEIKVSVTLLVVISLFVVSWAPISIVNCVETFWSVHEPMYVERAAVAMMYLQSAVNPIIYGLMNRNFRDGFKNLLKCKWSRPRK